MAAVPSADEADGDVDMDNFMVLDSVGSGDGSLSFNYWNIIVCFIIIKIVFPSDEGSEEGENAQDSKDNIEKKNKSKSKKEISLGKFLFCYSSAINYLTIVSSTIMLEFF